ncbi:hypothetical protein Dimus_031906, partial [Dionaea muscipula]
DLPDAMDLGAFHRLFAKFGVVKDVFVPRKRSKLGKRFGFVRYDCPVVAEVAIQKTNGLWIDDKELRVKMADYNRYNDRSGGWGEVMKGMNSKNGAKPLVEGVNHTQYTTRWVPKQGQKGSYANVVSSGQAWRRGAVNAQGGSGFRKEKTSDAQCTATRDAMDSGLNGQCTKVMQRGEVAHESLPVVKGVPIGNGWLYRSAVAIFTDHDSADVLLISFLSQVNGVVSTRILGRKRILITFSSDTEMNLFVDTHMKSGSFWFTSVEKWSVDSVLYPGFHGHFILFYAF